jgi:O-antigen ligase
MQDSAPTLSQLDHVSDQPGIEKHVKWLPIILVGIYFLSLWAPPVLRMPTIRWYMVLGLAIYAFLLHKQPFNIRAARIFLIVFGLSLLGAVISLVRAPFPNAAFNNTIAQVINGVIYLLFIPVLATRRARNFMLIVLICAAILATIDIQLLLNKYGMLTYMTFAETQGGDKNHIAFGLSLAGFSLIYLSVFWKPSNVTHQHRLLLMRLGLGFVGAFLYYYMLLIYARSAVLVMVTSIIAILFVLYVQNPDRRAALLRIGLAVFIIILSTSFIIPAVLTASPEWGSLVNSINNEGYDAFGHRELLIRKGLFLIRQNPFLGIGLGNSIMELSTVYDFFPGYWIHNLYITDWVEKGILGLLSNIIWILLYLRILKNKFLVLPITDQIWLICFLLVFVQMLFLDMDSITFMMMAILTGISYQQYQSERMQTGSIFSNPFGA